MSDSMNTMGKEHHGVPLGGIGTGAMELCADGRFRNISINNNRLPASYIPQAEHTFMAIRVASKESVYGRILQHAPENAPPAQNGKPPRLNRDLLLWRGAYPAVHYQIKDVECPVQVVWTAFAPLIPFDYDASTMPALFFSVRFMNPTETTLTVSALFNWENLCGRTGPRVSADPGRIKPILVEEQEEGESSPLPPAANGGTRLFNAVEFGSPRETPTNAHGHYCLAARRGKDSLVSAFVWDAESPEDWEHLWKRFLEHGDVLHCVSGSGRMNSGAVCSSFHLPPKQEHRADFVLTWYCPRNEAQGVLMGNGYTNKFSHAVDVARKGLRHQVYFFKAVEDWQKRLRTSSLPPWINRLLVNSTQILCTNSLYAKDGRIGFLESPQEPSLRGANLRLYSTLSIVLFFPRFEENELAQIARAMPASPPGRLCKKLGAAGSFEPVFDETDGGQMERCAHFVLSLYRNYLFTGSLPRLQELMPAARAAISATLVPDRDQDGIPDVMESITHDGVTVAGPNSPASGLWTAALCAYAKLLRGQGAMDEAARYEDLHKKAAAAFERLFWDGRLGYYRIGRNASDPICHPAQLAGQWYADFLGLGTLFHPSHIQRALDSLIRHMPRQQETTDSGTPPHVPKNLIWPGFDSAHLACLLIYRGRTEEALRLLEQYSQALNYQQCSPFNFPDKWDLGKNTLAQDSLGRHLSALSLWHVLYAVQGLELNIPEQSLRVAPHLFPGWHTLNTPLFTPACLGWLQYTEEVSGTCRQQLHLSFDSPVIVKTIELRVPPHVGAVHVHCEDADGTIGITHRMVPENQSVRVIITARPPVTVLNTLSVHLEARGQV